MIVDDVDADEQQATRAQRRADGFTDFAFARRQIGGARGAATHHVGTQIVRRGHAIHRACEFAVDQNDAFVALLDFRQEALDHPRFAEGHREHVVERSEIHVLRQDAKHRRAAVAVQWLHHHRAVLGAKGVDLVEITRDQRRRHQLGKVEHEQLFRRIAHARRIVDHQRLGVNSLEEMRAGDVGEIERRILPQQHHVERREIGPLRFAERVVIADLVADGERLHRCDDVLSVQGKLIRGVVGEDVAAPLRLQQEGECGIAAHIDARDGIHLDGDFQAHALVSGLGFSGIGLLARWIEMPCCQALASKAPGKWRGNARGATSTASKRMSKLACSGCAINHALAASTMRFCWRGVTA